MRSFEAIVLDDHSLTEFFQKINKLSRKAPLLFKTTTQLEEDSIRQLFGDIKYSDEKKEMFEDYSFITFIRSAVSLICKPGPWNTEKVTVKLRLLFVNLM